MLLMSLFLMISSNSYAQDIRVVLDEFPPYNYSEQGEVLGGSTEVVESILNILDMDVKFEVLPWSRAYKQALENENTLIYTIARNSDREGLFKWIGPISAYNAVLIAKADRNDIVINSLDDARRYKIGSTLKDVRTNYLLSKGFQNLQQVGTNRLNLKKLIEGRIDLWLEDEQTANYLHQTAKPQIRDQIKKIYTLEVGSGYGYMAFNNETSDVLVEKFRDALTKIMNDGTYAKIHARHVLHN